MKSAIEKLDDVTNIATSGGNYDCNPYMLGMANGLILARSIVKDEKGDVPYLEKPAQWLDDLPRSDVPTQASPGGGTGG